MNIFKFFLSTVILFLISFPLRGDTPALLQEKQKLVIAISQAPVNLSPFFASDGNAQNINRLMHLSLLDVNSQMEFNCRACVSYQESFNNNQYHLRFKLRTDLTFWDGQKVQAQDLAQSVAYFQGQYVGKGSIFQGVFNKISKVIVHAADDVEFVYSTYERDHIVNLVLLKIIKAKYPEVGANNSQNSGPQSEIIGAGEYFLQDIQPLEITLSPTTKFAHKPIFVFKVVKDETTLALKLINGEVDLSVATISPRKVDWLKSNYGQRLQFWERSGVNLNYIGINHKNTLLQKKEVRQALALLLPKDELIRYRLKGTATNAEGLLSPSFIKYSNFVAPSNQQIAKAIKILNDLGFRPSPQNGVRLKLSLKLNNNKLAMELAQIVADAFMKGGVELTVKGMEWGTFYRAFKEGDYELVWGSWQGITGIEMLKSVFYSQSFPPEGLNRGYYHNVEVDRLLREIFPDQSGQKLDQIQEIAKVKELQQLLAEEHPYLFLWYPNIVWISRPCMQIAELSPNGSFLPLLQVELSCQKQVQEVKNPPEKKNV